jgi:hypothetical protein
MIKEKLDKISCGFGGSRKKSNKVYGMKVENEIGITKLFPGKVFNHSLEIDLP